MTDETQTEHTNSYYAATLNEHLEFPPLQGRETADICVVGAGFTGIATALTLAERGYSVAVVEANRVGWGASGRNGGQLIGGISGESKVAKRAGGDVSEMLWKLRWRGNEIIRERVERYDIDCDLKSGYLDVAEKPRQMRDLEESSRKMEAHAFPWEFRIVQREEMRPLVGTDKYIGGLLNMCDGHLHPLNLCVGEARAARDLGARIFEQSTVTGIRHGDKPVVVTAEGEIQADAVVLAGNAYHRLERRHLSGLLFPAGSFIIATEPLSADLQREINPLDIAVCESSHILDYFRLSADGRMLFGGRCNYSGREPGSIKGTLMPRMLDTYPQLAEVGIDYEWGGRIGVVINRIPMFGRIGNNVWYAQGYSGHGVNVTHVAGEILADAIGGTLESFDLFEQMRHIRLPTGQWFGNQLVALGMMWFRMLDLRP